MSNYCLGFYVPISQIGGGAVLVSGTKRVFFILQSMVLQHVAISSSCVSTSGQCFLWHFPRDPFWQMKGIAYLSQTNKHWFLSKKNDWPKSKTNRTKVVALKAKLKLKGQCPCKQNLPLPRSLLLFLGLGLFVVLQLIFPSPRRDARQPSKFFKESEKDPERKTDKTSSYPQKKQLLF